MPLNLLLTRMRSVLRVECATMYLMSSLELELAERRNGRRYLDFVVDGQSLFDLIGYRFDTVSCLALWPNMAETHKALARLLLSEPADFPNNRRSLYVCGECGGLDCGAVSILIDEQQDAISWHSFGYENDWEDKLEIFEGLGPFAFSKSQYTETLEQAIAMLQHAS